MPSVGLAAVLLGPRRTLDKEVSLEATEKGSGVVEAMETAVTAEQMMKAVSVKMGNSSYGVER